MPAEELSRLIDQELGLQRRPPGAARPKALPGQRASSRSWVPQHLAAAMERDSGRKAPLPQPRLRSSIAMVLGWVLVGVLACASVNKLLVPSNVHVVVVGSSNQEEAWSATAPQPEKVPEPLALAVDCPAVVSPSQCERLDRAGRPLVFWHISKCGGTSMCLMALKNGEAVRTVESHPSFRAGRCAHNWIEPAADARREGLDGYLVEAGACQ